MSEITEQIIPELICENFLSALDKRLIKTIAEFDPSLNDSERNLLGLLLYRVKCGNALIHLKEENLALYFDDSNMPMPEYVYEAENEEKNLWIENRKQWHESCKLALKTIANHKVIVGEAKLFVLEDDSLFVRKYYDAKKSIIERMDVLFADNRDNKMITGGPGTGKTFGVEKIIQQLNPENKLKVCYAAPSGKAATNLNANGKTIHVMLGSNPAKGGFKFNKDNKLTGDIFVIDEASMIDAPLFASLLEAIPDNAKLFILGDKNQLPSVGVGAVFGDLLKRFPGKVETKTKTYRFSGDILEVSQAINKDNVSLNDFDKVKEVTEYSNDKNRENQISIYPDFTSEKFIKEWVRANYAKVEVKTAIADFIDCWKDFRSNNRDFVGKLSEDVLVKCKIAWQNTIDSAKILCCENHGKRGVETLNSLALKELKAEKIPSFGIKMITRNLHDKGLSNGDTGLVIDKDIFFKRDDAFYVMALDSIEPDAIMDSFAMTVHKSQGSGYVNVAVVLPEKDDHPLLTKQILYTAITRTKNILDSQDSEKIIAYGSCVILSTKDVLVKGANKKDIRETGIV